jgi:hypothetical protein
MVGRCRDTQGTNFDFFLTSRSPSAHKFLFFFILLGITIFIAEATIWHLNNKMKEKEPKLAMFKRKKYGISNKEGVFPETPFCI